MTPLFQRCDCIAPSKPLRLGVLALFAALCACGGGGGSSSGGATTTPTTPTTPSAGTDVTTYKNDVQRTGQNLTESVLTTSNVASSTFGLLRNLAVDGKVDAQPLYLSKLAVAGSNHNVVYVATENNSVYAFDSDTGATLWQVSLTGSGETTSDTHSCSQVTPQIGITSTPVIDRNAGAHGTVFAVAMTKDASGNYHQRLHALDVTTGAEMTGSPKEITATYLATSFAPGQYEERAALLLVNGTIYTSWTSHCDDAPYGGWLLAYSESTLAQTGVLNVAPGASGSGYSSQGPAIWMSGGGPAADAAGNVYVLTGNGRFETTMDANGFPSGGDYGNSFVKISSSGGVLAVSDYFALTNGVTESANDEDLGSGGILLLPDLTDANSMVHHLAVGAGKDGNLYVVSRDSLGKFNATANTIWQELDGALPGGIWSTPAYFNGSVYYGTSGGTLRAFSVTNAQLSSSAVSQTAMQFTYPGTAPVASANGTSNGIIWAYENTTPAVLHAFDASNLAHELYNSNQAANARDQFGAGNKYIAPTVADGKVFVASTNSVGVFGLLK
ncbi:MAG TPA: PQQ-binding-like beta-propeller repeat protein [Steroidobacteraceae bacterium]|nr:PQQ-binding-like beta-propeller repeat protein [Steroidobacteraceae bacterium]